MGTKTVLASYIGIHKMSSGVSSSTSSHPTRLRNWTAGMALQTLCINLTALRDPRYPRREPLCWEINAKQSSKLHQQGFTWQPEFSTVPEAAEASTTPTK